MDNEKALPAALGGSIGGTILLFCCLIAYLISQPLSFFSGLDDLLALRQEYLQSVGGSGEALAKIAIEEYEKYGGTACGSNYWPGSAENWCCDFVYWCADQLGYVGEGQIFGPRTGYCPTAISQLAAAGAMIYYPGDGTVPQAGDIIFFSTHYSRPGQASDGVSDWASHVGIVIEGTETTVTTIEGNTGGGGPSGSTISRYTYSLTGSTGGGSYILEFFRPSYPAGSLDSLFYFSIDNPDSTYSGQAMTLTQEEQSGVIRTIYFEYGISLEGSILVAQTIRDNTVYNTGDIKETVTIMYEPYGRHTYWSTRTDDLELDSQSYQNVLAAFDYVFNQGGSAVQHKIFCYYSPYGSIQTDADYQAQFLAPLEFVIQFEEGRWFSY